MNCSNDWTIPAINIYKKQMNYFKIVLHFDGKLPDHPYRQDTHDRAAASRSCGLTVVAAVVSPDMSLDQSTSVLTLHWSKHPNEWNFAGWAPKRWLVRCRCLRITYRVVAGSLQGPKGMTRRGRRQKSQFLSTQQAARRRRQSFYDFNDLSL